MLKKISCFIVLFSCISFSQTITVDDTSYSATDLANLLLNGSCIDPTNVSHSSEQAVAQFSGNGSSFPITEGIIIRTGIAKYTEGIYTDTNLSSQLNTNSDPSLQTVSNNNGQTGLITDTAFLQFDFVPISSDFSFDFIFASNEYGQWQCGYSDVFQFLLTDLNTNITTNLAIIPGTNDPIAVSTIRDNEYNGGCTSENSNLFDTYNVNSPATSALNMRGYTTLLNASSILTPDVPYRIRLVIGDYSSETFDSAVFIDTGSFTTEIEPIVVKDNGTEIDFGDEITICTTDEFDITTSLDENNYTHSWFLDGTPIGGSGNTITISQAGVYSVIAIKNGTACQVPGTITITDLQISSPGNLTVCNDGSSEYTYNLNTNNETVLGIDPDNYDIIYYASEDDFENNIPITNNITNYPSPGTDVPIYIKTFNNLTGQFCDALLSFLLTTSPSPVATKPADIEICESPNITTLNLTTQDSQILFDLDPVDFIITYYASQADLENEVPITGSSIDIEPGSNIQEVFVLMTSSSNADCFDTTSFNINTNSLPVVTTLEDVVECHEYTLLAITDGNYYDGPNGTGNMLNADDVIDEGGTYYIYNGPDANGCFNESSFIITLIDEHSVELHHCSVFSVPVLPPGDFYTETDGPNGTGTIIDPITVFTTADLPLTVHYFAETTDPNTDITSVCRNDVFDITIYDLPPVDEPDDIVTCISYELPVLTDGVYYDAPNSSGNMLSATDVITTSGTYYVYNSEVHNFINSEGTPDSITCESDWPFEIDIINEPGDITRCGSYELPPLEVGNYFSASGGAGTTYSVGFEITPDNSPMTFYIYAETQEPDTTTNCTNINNFSFVVTVNPNPIVDELPDVTNCIDNPYKIEPLSKPGAYYVDDQLEELPISNTTYTVGQTITTDSTIYIYMQDAITGCETQSSFDVEIRDLPELDNPGDKYPCDKYELPPLTDGNYYSGSNGTGTMYLAGEEIISEIPIGTIADEVIKIYIYNEWDDLEGCSAEREFTIYFSGINLGAFDLIDTCDSYTLPILSVGDYYWQPNGVDKILPQDYVIDLDTPEITSGIPTTIYVYAENIIRDPEKCIAEESFTITISDTPELSDFSNEVVCGEFLLQTLDNSNYNVNYYSQPGGNAADVIDVDTPRTIPVGENTPFTETIYVYATATDNTNCFDEESFTLTIHPLLNFTIDDAIICVDPETGVADPLDFVLLESGLDSNQFIINWYLNNSLVFTGPDYLAEEAGEYTVETSIIGAETPPNCNYNSTIVTVFESSPPIATYSITEDFDNTATISVTITNGNGEYQYQLDDNPFQDSNEFHDVESGEHTITINDIYGNCGIFTLPVLVLKYPFFFTPNGDSVNDTWNITSLANQPGAIINIFDRFGKFIVQISPTGMGWDGSYNNSQLPSTDYWFVVSYKGKNNEDKEYKAHFSLKR